MFRNYLNIALRNIIKYKALSAINISGLGLGIACCILLVMFIQYEFSYDTFNKNYPNIYRMSYTIGEGDDVVPNVKSPEPLARTLMAEVPEVVKAGRLFPNRDVVVRAGDVSFTEDNFYYADPEILDIFSFNVLHGGKSLLKDPNTVVITEEVSEKYFGNINPIGKTLVIFDKAVEVTGVVESLPVNSHFHPSFLFSYSSSPSSNSDNWGWTDPRTYFLLKEGHTSTEIDRKMVDIVKKYNVAWYNFSAQPLSAIHLYSNKRGEFEPNGSITYIYVMATIAVFILVIACINFMNLSSAHATLRGKEVGMRKVAGAVRTQLVVQFLGEAFVMTAIAFALAIAIAYLSLPLLNDLMQKSVTINLFSNTPLLITMLIVMIVVGLGSGLYPAFYLSAFKPILTLKGNKNGGTGSLILRKSLVVFQFTISIVLIIGTLTIINQLKFIQNKNLGFNKNELVVIPLPSKEAVEKYKVLVHAIRESPHVVEVTGAVQYPGKEHPMYAHWAEGSISNVQLYDGSVDADYFKVMQIPLKDGRTFSSANPTDLTDAVVINEEAAKILGYGDNAIGKMIYSSSPDDKQRKGRTVVGVVKNYHSRSLKETIEPLFLVPRENCPNIIARIESKDISATLHQLGDKFKEINPDLPFESFFMDQNFAETYAAENRLTTIVKVFTGLAIFISCIGLLGLISFTVEQKVKEIGVRKILGASATQIMLMLLSDSARYVVIALLVASPLSYYLMSLWLESYAYRTTMGWSEFLIAGITLFSVALSTIAFGVIKAALANPAKALRAA
ncbi:MAG: ABC transporter permease [Chryseolinea sp.]